MTTVWPSCTRPAKSSSIDSDVRESRLPVGSSASSSAGSLASARAMATRCCCPPDSVDGSLSAWSATPQRSSSAERALAALARRPGAAEIHRQHDVLGRGERRQQLEELEHDADGAPAPRRSARVRAACAAAVPPTTTSPRVGRSMPAKRPSSVDLPLPGLADDGDELAARRCRRLTSSSAVKPPAAVGVGLGDVAQDDQGFVHAVNDTRPRRPRGAAAVPFGGPDATVGRKRGRGRRPSRVGCTVAASAGGTMTIRSTRVRRSLLCCSRACRRAARPRRAGRRTPRRRRRRSSTSSSASGSSSRSRTSPSLAARIHGMPEVPGHLEGVARSRWLGHRGRDADHRRVREPARARPMRCACTSPRRGTGAARRSTSTAPTSPRRPRNGATARCTQRRGAPIRRAAPTSSRTRFYDITPTSFRFQQDRSYDDGKTWTEGF